MINELLKDVIGDFPGWLALFLQLISGGKKPAEAAREVVKQRLPHMFGIGRMDEQLLESLLQLLTFKARRLILLLIEQMQDYEADIFRITITGMSCGSEVVDDPVRNPQRGQPATSKKTVSWELTKKDLRVKYLGDIAREITRRTGDLGEQVAAMFVVADMRSRRLITRSPAAQKAYELWVEGIEWVRMEVLDFFGIDNFNELTDNVIATKLNLRIEELVQRHPETLSVTSVVRTIGNRVVVREELHTQVPGVFSLMAADVRNFFNAIQFWR